MEEKNAVFSAGIDGKGTNASDLNDDKQLKYNFIKNKYISFIFIPIGSLTCDFGLESHTGDNAKCLLRFEQPLADGSL